MIHVARRHWVMAFAGALAVHAGVAVTVLWQPAESGAMSAGTGGVRVSLGPAGGAPGSVASVVRAERDAEKLIDQASAEAEAVEAERIEVAEVKSMETAMPAKKTAAQTVEQADAAEVAETVAAQDPGEVAERQRSVGGAEPTIPAVEAPLRDESAARAGIVPSPPKPKPKPPLPTKAKAEPESVEEPAEKTARRTAQAEGPKAKQTSALLPSAPGSGGKAGTGTKPKAGSADDSSGGGIAGEAADYMALLQAWLEKHKEYPRRARMRRQEGTALLYFVMDRSGRILEYRVQKSSGHDLLDREVEAMIERAQPLPEMPEEMQQARLELVVPVQFFLR